MKRKLNPMRYVMEGLVQARSETRADHLVSLPFGHRVCGSYFLNALGILLICTYVLIFVSQNLWSLVAVILTMSLLAGRAAYIVFWDLQNTFDSEERDRFWSRVADSFERKLISEGKSPYFALQSCLEKYEKMNLELSLGNLIQFLGLMCMIALTPSVSTWFLLPLVMGIIALWVWFVRAPLSWLRNINQKYDERK